MQILGGIRLAFILIKKNVTQKVRYEQKISNNILIKSSLERRNISQTKLKNINEELIWCD